jgi:hypothetical protein
MSRVLLALLLLPAAVVADEVKPPEGFVALFNGKDLTNWQGLVELPAREGKTPEQLAEMVKQAGDTGLNGWKVQDGGVLYFDPNAPGKKYKRSLQTAKDYGNFELLIDWKLAPKGDSGIYLRGNPQVQMWDSDNAKGEDHATGSGGLWNNAKGSPGKIPLKRADRPIGEWNTFRIVMVGDQVTVYLNGELVVDKAPLRNYWDKGMKPLPAKGPIELQDHGDPLWFRNVFIKELPD